MAGYGRREYLGAVHRAGQTAPRGRTAQEAARARGTVGPTLSAREGRRWLARWDEQQEAFLPLRETKFSIMFDVAEAAVGRRFRALDLGSGPGPLSARLLQRFPAARVWAVDYDPVTLRVGQSALGDAGGRLAWVDSQLGAPGWTRALPARRFDVAFSTTALHWLKAPQLDALYEGLARKLRPGGLLLNGDYLPWSGPDRDLARLARDAYEVRRSRAPKNAGWKKWERWWEDARRVPALKEAFAEQARRRAAHPHHAPPPLADHAAALRRAGFRRVAVVWQDLEDRILLARR